MVPEVKHTSQVVFYWLINNALINQPYCILRDVPSEVFTMTLSFSPENNKQMLLFTDYIHLCKLYIYMQVSLNILSINIAHRFTNNLLYKCNLLSNISHIYNKHLVRIIN